MSRTIGIISIKGGVGKTTVASSLATDLANHHKQKVLLLDGNFSAPNLGLHMDIVEPRKSIHEVLAGKARMSSAIHSRYGVDVVPGDYVYRGGFNPLKLKDRLKGVSDHYDFTIIDSSPSLNDELLATMISSDLLFVVSTPDYPTLSCSLSASRLAKQRGKPISGVILNKIRDPAFELSLREIEKTTEIPVVARLPDDKSNVRSLFTRIPMPVYSRRSPFSREINRLGSALVGSKEERGFLKSLFPFDFNKEAVNRQILKEKLYSRSFV